MVIKFNYQREVKDLVIWTDTDFGGCRRTRKSTSGGIAMIGNHFVKSWCATPSIESLSSGEAEYYGIVKGSSMGPGVRSTLMDLGVNMGVKVRTDSSAAKGIANRKGFGNVRHIEVNQLWVQDRVARGDLIIEKLMVRKVSLMH